MVVGRANYPNTGLFRSSYTRVNQSKKIRERALQAHLTGHLLRSLQAPPRRHEIWDTQLPGFYAQVRKSGVISFYVRCRFADGARLNLRIGPASVLTVAEARTQARKLLAQALTGQLPDPRQPPPETIAEVIEKRYIPHIKARKKSWHLDVGLLNKHILPFFGKRALNSLTVAEIDLFHKELRETKKLLPASCNHVLFILRRLFKLAIDTWELPGVTENPARKVENFKLNNVRQVYLKHDEIARLLSTARGMEVTYLAEIVAFLLLTGVRRTNALEARWVEFDFESQVWHVPHTKSGKPQDIWLSPEAVALLQALPSRDSSPWCFPNPKTGSAYRFINHAWNRLCAAAGFPNLHIHDLRHTFASLMVQSGFSLFVVQNALGHQNPSMTMRYAHLADDTLRSAVSTVGAAIARELGDTIPQQPCQPVVSR